MPAKPALVGAKVLGREQNLHVRKFSLFPTCSSPIVTPTFDKMTAFC
jgi:hypothetical protein